MLEWLGYIASFVVLVSLLMTSIKKLRWINLFGAIMFGAYGFMINSIPTGLMNLGIAVIDIYFLYKIYSSKDYFKLLKVDHNSEYLDSFVQFYNDDISKFQNIKDVDLHEADVRFYILRNMNPAGVFIAKKTDDRTLEVLLDYAVPQYRDFKLGDYLFGKQVEFFKEQGYTRLISYADQEKHMQYLEKMGFIPREVNNRIVFIKELKKGE